MTVLVQQSGTVATEPSAAKGAPSRGGRPACRHCGAPLIDARMLETGFCCAGCSYVYRLIHEQGLAGYYRIKDEVTAPADAGVFQLRDYSWLEEAQRVAEAAPRDPPLLTLDVQGISCAGCVWLIERVFQTMPGARDVYVNAQYGSMRLRWVRGQFSAVAFARKLQTFGYLVGPAGEAPSDSESRALVRRIGLCAAFAMNVMLFTLPTYFGMEPTFEWAGLFRLLSLLFGTLSFLVGGTYFVGRAARALREGAMHIDLPIAIGVLGAYLGSLYGWLAGMERLVYFDFVSTFILLMLVGRWAQTAAVERNRIRLLRRQPRPQRVRLAGGSMAAPDQIQPRDRFFLAAGQTLPIEARLESGEALFSLASINGEAEPRLFRAAQRVPAGAVNVTRGDVSLEALQSWDDSLLAQLMHSSDRESENHPLVEKIVRGYVAGIILVALAAGAFWLLRTGDARRTGAVVVAVLVVSCPCAIGLAFPLADETAAVALRRRGVFIRVADLWNRLGRVRKLVFDKTGTLTLERPVLLNPDVLERLDDPARAALLALVQDNPHPVSESLREELLARSTVVPLAGAVEEIVGLGVRLGRWSLGRPGWAGAPAGEPPKPPSLADASAADAVLTFDQNVVAWFRFADHPRSDARREIELLERAGLAVYILSGDRPDKVTALATELGLSPERARGELTPREKADWIDQHGHSDVLMLGDGANDSLAFDHALCRGTPVIHRGVLERKADFYYLGRGIAGLRDLFEIDRLRRRTHTTVLVFSVAYNVAAVGLALAGRMNPLLAAVLMPLNSLLTLALVTGGMRSAFRR
ncbi:MAG TPA: heavy metal translocating P-type ATPase metal-binding domain-containing protein [Opitutaceae bacterium]|nr:heavy metal translocating P-type ATPase metal-binding domain-containing protein [Opitutaceae bacterium]